MKKVIFSLSILFVFPVISNSQVSYFKNTYSNCFGIAGGIGMMKADHFISTGLSYGIQRFAIGIQYERGWFTDSEGDYDAYVFTPYMEHVLIRGPVIGITAGIGYSLARVERPNQADLIPVFASVILDLSKENEGFTLIPELSLGKVIMLGGDQTAGNLNVGLALNAMFRKEKGVSFLLHPGFTLNTDFMIATFSLSGAIVIK